MIVRDLITRVDHDKLIVVSLPFCEWGQLTVDSMRCHQLRQPGRHALTAEGRIGMVNREVYTISPDAPSLNARELIDVERWEVRGVSVTLLAGEPIIYAEAYPLRQEGDYE